MSKSKWLADKALAQLRNVPRLDLKNVARVGMKPVRNLIFDILEMCNCHKDIPRRISREKSKFGGGDVIS